MKVKVFKTQIILKELEKKMIGKICGTGSYLPDYIIDNFKLAESVDTSDEWIQERTGIRQRHIAKRDHVLYGFNGGSEGFGKCRDRTGGD